MRIFARFFCVISFVVCVFSTLAQGVDSIVVVVDSDITLAEALKGSTAPQDILDRQRIVSVEYYSTDELLHRGQIVVDSSVVEDIVAIFEFVKERRIIVEMVIPIKFDLPGGNTTMSRLNNTYGFHYRLKIGGTSPSNHSYGTAVDFNPFNNPFTTKEGRVVAPSGGVYDLTDCRVLTPQSELVLEFKSRGWVWGGDWTSVKDYMHFEYPGL